MLGRETAMASSYWFNVMDYGATGNGSTDDTTAIQTAINAVPASGGTVVFPAGTYKISSALVVRSNLILQGVSDGSAVISQSSTTANGLSGSDITRLTIQDLRIQGPASGSGKGIVLTRTSNPATVSLAFARLTVRHFGGTGIDLSNPIVSTFDSVTSANNGNHGWDIRGVSGEPPGPAAPSSPATRTPSPTRDSASTPWPTAPSSAAPRTTAASATR
ncbi:hypothetical protein EBF04_29655 [Streptomyces sp. I6]|nr:hypothetical protein EBF04_29655 [Streptomyces sp. I6]